MIDKRPVELQLFAFKFPFTAILSILHRISGTIVFFLIPVFLYGAELAMHSEDNFLLLIKFFTNPFVAIPVWGFLIILIYHMFAGVRHLIMDFGIFESKKSANLTGMVVITITVIVGALLGVCLW